MAVVVGVGGGGGGGGHDGGRVAMEGGEGRRAL